MILRPYQTEGLRRLRESYAKGNRSVLAVGPTGMGKTVCIAELVRTAQAKEKRVLVLVHRRELVGQTISKLRSAGIERIGVIAAGLDEDATAPVIIAMIQTLLARDRKPDVDVVIFDEAHHYCAAEWGALAAHYANVPRLGFTATPERSDGTPLGDLFDDLVVITTTKELIECGHLVPVDVIAPTKRQGALAADPIEAYEEHALGRPAVVFAQTVAAAKEFADRFNAVGVAAAAIDGETPSDERDNALDRFESGELRVLCNIFCLTEGWDSPRAEVAILARGFSHVSSYIQAVGRVLRPSPSTGKERALVIDLRGVSVEHGLPDEERTYSLTGRAISLGGAPMKDCPQCGDEVPMASSTCPECGWEFPPRKSGLEVSESPLKRLTHSERERLFWDHLVDDAHDRGYRLGWAVHRWKEKFGRFPAKFWRQAVAA